MFWVHSAYFYFLLVLVCWMHVLVYSVKSWTVLIIYNQFYSHLYFFYSTEMFFLGNPKYYWMIITYWRSKCVKKLHFQLDFSHFMVFIFHSVSSGHCWTRPLHRLCWHEISAPRQVDWKLLLPEQRQLQLSHDLVRSNWMIYKPSFVHFPQGEAGGTRSAAESSTHGVRHCKYWLLTKKTCVWCTLWPQTQRAHRSGCIIPKANLSSYVLL